MRRTSSIWILMAGAALAGTAASLLAGAAEHREAPPAQASPSPSPSAKVEARRPMKAPAAEECTNDIAILDEMKSLRESLEAKVKEVSAREEELKARERALEDEFRKIEAAREDIAKFEAARQKESEEKVAKLVETVESMNPKAGAVLLGGLDERLSIAAMARMSTAKLAKIMNIMEPARAARLTELLAGVVRAKGLAPKEPALTAKSAAATTSVKESGTTAEGR